MTEITPGTGSLPDVIAGARKPGEQILGLEVRQERVSARVKNGRLEAVERGHEQYQSARVLVDGRMGYRGSRAVDWADLLEGARSASAVGPVAAFKLSDLAGAVSTPGQEAEPPSPEALVQMVTALDRALSAAHPDFVPTAEVRWTRRVTHMADGEGHEHAWVTTQGQASLSGRAVRDGDFHTVSASRWHERALPEVGALVSRVLERVRWGQEIVRVEASRYPMVIMPPIGHGLLTSVMARLSAPAVVTKASPWADSLHERVLSPMVSMWCDPAAEDGPRNAPLDDEGTPTARLALIAEGRMEHRVVDRQAAHQLGIAPPGLAFAGELGSPPTPRPSNLTVDGGSLTWEDLITSHPRLLILEGWIGGRPVNPLNGDIAGTATGLYLVDHGTVQGRIKNAVVSLNAIQAFGDRLLGVGRDRQWAGGGMMGLAPAYLPPLLVDGVGVALKST
jgi:PmbA protein